MQAVYDVDQAQEANIKAMAARGRWKSAPASVWRWLPYNAAGAALLRRIQDAGYQDEGTGSTFAALDQRGLIICQYEPGSLGSPILLVQITKAGRKLVRDALGVQAPRALPVGTLREWHWRALCRAYVRGEQGMGYDQDKDDGFGYVSWNTCLRLRDYRLFGQDMPLIREGRRGEQFALRITNYGRLYYRENWQRYPAVDAPAPEPDEHE